MLPVTYIEGHQWKVLHAKQRLSDRTLQANLVAQREASRSQAIDVKARIETEKSLPTIVAEINRLKSKRADLMKELETIKFALAVEEKKLEQLPVSIEQMKEDLKTPIKEALRLHKKIQPIPGSADADQHEIDEVDQLRLRAMDTV